MASYLRGSTNYVWSTTSILGKGATAAVHQGVNKLTGEPVAVKVFNQCSALRSKEVQGREFDLMQKVKHENIVKLLAIEEEQDNRGKVIVMELCTGGSLFTILDDPENTYGLEESEFLLVLGHVYAGMEYLRSEDLVHRDLKPGNIMKFIREDGTTIYKLTDFGAARRLEEGQQFHSLYGTEEYLHPDMYCRAVLQKRVEKAFGATIDLWSIGVTLYHVATGNLPFRPFGGRKNRETMYHITTKKQSGVISGIQLKEQGPIEWKYDLPNSCQLSAGLKKILTPLIAGLLEVDSKKIWTFDQFFAEVNSVLSRTAVNIFNVNNAQLLKVYIKPDESYLHLQSYITEQTETPSNNQILLMKNALFVDVVGGEGSRASGYPKTSESEPLFLFNRGNNDVVISPEQELPKFTRFTDVVSVDKDASQAKITCSIGHLSLKRIEKYSMACKLIFDTVDNFTKFLNAELKQLNQDTQHLLEKTDLLKNYARQLELSQQIAKQQSLRKFSDNLNEISKDFETKIAVCIQNLHREQTVEDKLKCEWDKIARDLLNPFKTLAPARGKTKVEHLRESWQHLVRDRATRVLSYNDEQFHILEGVKINHIYAQLKTLLEVEVYKQFAEIAENFGDWYKMAQNNHLKTNILLADVGSFNDKLKDFQMDVAMEAVEFNDNLKNNIHANNATIHKTMKQTRNVKIKTKLKELKLVAAHSTDNVNENSKLVQKMANILESLSIPD